MLTRRTPLKRSGWLRAAPAWPRDPDRIRATPTPVLGAFRAGAPLGDHAIVVPKNTPAKDERYRRLVASLPCIRCGVQGFSQAAHPNAGKGMGTKASDYECFPLCCDRPGVRGCHSVFDQGAMFEKQHRRQIEQAWAAETARALCTRKESPKNYEKDSDVV